MPRASRAALAAVSLLFLAAACGDTEPTVAGPQADAANEEPADPAAAGGEPDDGGRMAVACGPVRFDDRNIDVASLTPFTDDLLSYVGEAAMPEFELWDLDAVDFYEVERTSRRLVLFGVKNPPPTADEAPYLDAVFAKADGRWEAEGWGDCRLTVDAPGFGVAELALDPAAEVNERTTSLNLLATERECASGQAPVDREIVPVVAETDRHIEIVVLVEPVEGGAECPSNPAFPITIELDQPVGERRIMDMAFEPSTELQVATAVRNPTLDLVLGGTAPAEGSANVVLWSATETERANGFGSGGLFFSGLQWEGEPGFIQSFAGTETRTISGFVAACGQGCPEECESDSCDGFRPATGVCELTYERNDEVDTTLTVTFGPAADGASCTIEATTEPIGG